MLTGAAPIEETPMDSYGMMVALVRACIYLTTNQPQKRTIDVLFDKENIMDRCLVVTFTDHE